MHRRILLMLFALAALGASVAIAGWEEVLPRSMGNGIYLDLFTSYERDELTTDFRGTDWNDLFFREKLTFFSNGFFYDPRFMQYQFSVAGALKQEDFSANYLPSDGWRNGTGYEYDIRAFFLPEHPYNLELYALRFQPLLRQLSSPQSSNIQTSWGGLFRYRDKPWFFSSRFNDTTTESGLVTSDVRQFTVDGEYFKRYPAGNQFSVNASFHPTHFSNSTGIDGDVSEYSVGGLVDVQKARLTSTLTRNTITQDNGFSGTFENDQTLWYEVLNLYFARNFRSDISYRIQDYENRVTSGPVLPGQDFDQLNKIFEVDLIHRLYESLDTTFTHVDNTRTSTGGDTDYTLNQIGFNYNKLIPHGRFLAGMNFGRSLTETRGEMDIVDESHPGVAVPGSFLLQQQNVDRSSIVVFLRSPLPPFDVIQLVENVHYTLLPISNTFEVQVVTLPPQFALPGTFDFTVSYSLTTGTFDLRTDDIGYNVSVDLLDGLFTPYYSMVAIRSDVLSGVFPGIPLDSTTRTLGLRFYRDPLRGLVEYQHPQWEVSPYRAWRAEIQYTGNLNDTTRCYAIGSYVNKYFPHGTSQALQDSYTDQSISASGSLQKQVPSLNLMFSVGGTVSRLNGRVDGSAYSLNSSLTYRVGKIDITAGATAYQSGTESDDFSNDRRHQYYYFNLRRSFF